VHKELAQAGIAVYGYDHHGHGLSEPTEPRDRALVQDFDYLVSHHHPFFAIAGSIALPILIMSTQKKPIVTLNYPESCSPLRSPLQVNDSEEFAQMIRNRYSPDIPCIAGGQSMGGLIATHLVLRDQSAWAGLILCSAAIDVEWNLVLRSDILTRSLCFTLERTIPAKSYSAL